MPRRAGRARLLPLLAALLAALLVPSQAGAAPVAARAADSFADSVGVDLHTPFSDTPYVSEFATVKQRLAELGVRHIRDDLFPSRPDQYQRLDELAAQGIGSTLVMGSPKDGIAGMESLLEVAADLDGLEAIEGPNEYSTAMPHDPDWVEHLTEYQEALYAKAKADPALGALPVIGPSIVHGDQGDLGDISAHLDLGNIHSYPQGNPPDKLGSFIVNAKKNSGAKPIVATETGYNTALNWSGENPPVSEAAMATYVPRLFLEYFRWGIVRTYSYELLDQFPDPELDEKESNFGLLRNDLAPKPAFGALRNLIAILEDPGPAFAPGALDYTLSETGVAFPGPESGDLHKVLLQKRDGSFYLALWRLASVWDPVAKTALDAPTEPVELRVEPGIEALSEYRPNESAAPLRSLAWPQQPLTIEVGPAVTILRIVPGEPQPQEPLPTTGDREARQPRQGDGPGASADNPKPPPDNPKPPPRCVVPRLAGRTLPSARTRLRAAHCRLGAVRGTRRDRHHGKRRVVRQRPQPGRVFVRGKRVGVKLRVR